MRDPRRGIDPGEIRQRMCGLGAGLAKTPNQALHLTGALLVSRDTSVACSGGPGG